MLYFKFKELKNKKNDSSLFLINFLSKILKLIIPNSNPDYDNLFDKVDTWLIEYDEINNYTNREIGLDLDNTVILKSPYKENLGLWTDEDLSFEDYKKFNISKIDSTEFEKFWKK